MPNFTRTTAATAAIAAALLLAGCSSDGDKSDGGKDNPDHSASAGNDGGDTSPAAKSGDVEGAWQATTNGKILAMTVSGGKVVLAGEHACAGEVSDKGMVMLTLECPDGNTDRTAGMVTAGSDGKSLKVKWDAGIEDNFTKITDGKLPEGLPTDGLPTDLPDFPTP